MSGEPRQAAGLRLLAERIAALPDALRGLGATPNPPIPLATAPIRRFVTTGIGSSRAHARFLADRLTASLGVSAESVPVSSLAAPPPGSASDVLVVFSQGLAPSVRPLLSAPERWARVILVTAASGVPRELREAGGIVRRIPAENEFGQLVRIVGPMIGYLECLRIEESIARELSLPLPSQADFEGIATIVEGARQRLDRLVESGAFDEIASLERGLAFLALGRYGELALNLQQKVLEGMLLPWPPVWDLLEFAHGPFQQLFERPATLLALMHAGEATEAKLIDRLGRMLVPERHRLVVLESTLPGSLAIFEHEALLDQLLLRFVEERGIDPASWPGRGLDGPLYEAEDWLDDVSVLAVADPPRALRCLGDFTWPELERAIADGRTTVVLPLGSTEQHGPHLPFATDTRIADALADRFCARVGAAIRLPALALGCSSEHLGFPGTLTLSAETLTGLLRDVIEPLAASGFERVFVFSAHGGNFAALAAALPELRAIAAPLEVLAFIDLDGLTAALQREASAHGIAAEVSGHHAGETETSIMLALDAASVRGAALTAGFVEPTADPQSLFYPRLRPRAPSGTVGDPTAADAARGERYLEIWADLLIAAYRGEKNDR